MDPDLMQDTNDAKPVKKNLYACYTKALCIHWTVEF